MWNRKRRVCKNYRNCLPLELGVDWNWMFWIDCLRGARSVSSFCYMYFRKITIFDFTFFSHFTQATFVFWILLLTHWERRPHIYCYEGINLYRIIKLATEISLFSLQFSETCCVDKIKFGNPFQSSCQFTLKIVIFNLFMLPIWGFKDYFA